MRFQTSPELHLAFSCHSPGIYLVFPDIHLTTWPSSDLPLTLTYLTYISSFYLKKVVWLWTLSQGPLLTFRQLVQELTRTWERTLSLTIWAQSIHVKIWSWKLAVRPHPYPNLSPRHPSFYYVLRRGHLAPCEAPSQWWPPSPPYWGSWGPWQGPDAWTHRIVVIFHEKLKLAYRSFPILWWEWHRRNCMWQFRHSYRWGLFRLIPTVVINSFEKINLNLKKWRDLKNIDVSVNTHLFMIFSKI